MVKATLYTGSGNTETLKFQSLEEARNHFKTKGYAVEFLSDTDLKWFQEGPSGFTPVTLEIFNYQINTNFKS